MLILGIIGSGLLIGALAQFLLGATRRGVDWGMALGAGLLGSFVGGLLISLLSGDGLAFEPSGVIGSVVGAILVTLGWGALRKRQARQERKAVRAVAKGHKGAGRPKK